MARLSVLVLLLNSLFMSSLSMDIQMMKVYPKRAISGVFQVSLGKEYALNANAARDICQQLGVTIASKAQVLEAQKHGLETCRFGWIDEQIAVVPRVHMKSTCGNGQTGVVVWRADLNKKFDVFCFNSTDFDAQTQASVTVGQRSTRKPSTTHSSVFPTAGGGAHLKKTSVSKAPSSPPLLRSLSSSIAPSLSLNYIDDTEKHLPLSGTPVSIGAVPAALLITVTFAVLLTVFLALYYFKTNRPCLTLCDEEQQKEYIETEVWEHCSKKELQKTQEEEEEDEEEEKERKEEDNHNNNSSSETETGS